MISVDEFKDFVLIVQIYGDVSEEVLQKSARLVQHELQSDPKISKMDVFGKKRTELRVEIDMEKLHAYGMSLENVSKVLSENNIEFGFGKLKNDNGYISLRADNQLKEHEDFRDITLISEAGGAKVLLRDVAKIVDGYEDDDLKAVYQGGHNSVGIILYTSNKGHLIEVSDAAKKIVDKLQKQSPPEGVYIDIWQMPVHI